MWMDILNGFRKTKGISTEVKEAEDKLKEAEYKLKQDKETADQQIYKANCIIKQQEASEMRAVKDVGDMFNYLGLQCVVTKIRAGRPCTKYSFEVPTAMCYDYISGSGEIKNMQCVYDELDAIRKQNPPQKGLDKYASRIFRGEDLTNTQPNV